MLQKFSRKFFFQRDKFQKNRYYFCIESFQLPASKQCEIAAKEKLRPVSGIFYDAILEISISRADASSSDAMQCSINPFSIARSILRANNIPSLSLVFPFLHDLSPCHLPKAFQICMQVRVRVVYVPRGHANTGHKCIYVDQSRRVEKMLQQ